MLDYHNIYIWMHTSVRWRPIHPWIQPFCKVLNALYKVILEIISGEPQSHGYIIQVYSIINRSKRRIYNSDMIFIEKKRLEKQAERAGSLSWRNSAVKSFSLEYFGIQHSPLFWIQTWLKIVTGSLYPSFGCYPCHRRRNNTTVYIFVTIDLPQPFT